MCGRVNSAQVSDKQSSAPVPAGTKSKQLGPNLLQSASKPQTDRFFATHLFLDLHFLQQKQERIKKRIREKDFSFERSHVDPMLDSHQLER